VNEQYCFPNFLSEVNDSINLQSIIPLIFSNGVVLVMMLLAGNPTGCYSMVFLRHWYFIFVFYIARSERLLYLCIAHSFTSSVADDVKLMLLHWNFRWCYCDGLASSTTCYWRRRPSADGRGAKRPCPHQTMDKKFKTQDRRMQQMRFVDS